MCGRGTLRRVDRPDRHRIELVDDAAVDEPARSTPLDGRRRWWVTGLGIVAIAAVATLLLPLATPDRTSEGRQVGDAEPVEIGNPEADGWVAMVPLATDDRAGFPTPVVQHGSSICVGFARVDFGPDDVRPSLARCVPAASEPIGTHEIRRLVSVKSGLDTWHFIEAGGDVTTVSGSIGPNRVHLAGPVIGLRLENGVGIDDVTWSTRDGSFTCEPDDGVWQTGVFCPDDA